MIYKCKHHGVWKGVINKTWNMEKYIIMEKCEHHCHVRQIKFENDLQKENSARVQLRISLLKSNAPRCRTVLNVTFKSLRVWWRYHPPVLVS